MSGLTESIKVKNCDIKKSCYLLHCLACAMQKAEVSWREMNKRRGEEQGFPMAGDQLLAEREKNWGLRNINQTLHLVGSHMAEQHVHRANLLIASNRVQLIPLAASSTGLPVKSPGREGCKKCCSSFSYPKTEGSNTVMNEGRARALVHRLARKWLSKDGGIRGGRERVEGEEDFGWNEQDRDLSLQAEENKTTRLSIDVLISNCF